MSIEVKNLSYSYLKKSPNKVTALDNVSISFATGEITALVGQTGSGKSTTLYFIKSIFESAGKNSRSLY